MCSKEGLVKFLPLSLKKKSQPAFTVKAIDGYVCMPVPEGVCMIDGQNDQSRRSGTPASLALSPQCVMANVAVTFYCNIVHQDFFFSPPPPQKISALFLKSCIFVLMSGPTTTNKKCRLIYVRKWSMCFEFEFFLIWLLKIARFVFKALWHKMRRKNLIDTRSIHSFIEIWLKAVFFPSERFYYRHYLKKEVFFVTSYYV